ncbi:MAG: sensor histidine kinase N-terminal domain-containing protein, partial [Alphaproteobacteria bacterium]|nr:sensor histidine kinase N-terminal domain-containing protein [Alphaproteobacteria bacterium]
MRRKTYSLRLRLLSLIGIPVVITGIVMGGLALLSTYNEIDEVYDAQLAQNAKLLLRMTQHEIMDHKRHGLHLDAEAFDFSHFYERKLWYRIWQKGRLITQSREAGAFRDVMPVTPGFSRQDIGGIHWRFFVYADPKTAISVEVAENSEVRTELIMQILGSLVTPGLIFLPLILVIVWTGTTESLRPIRSIAEELNLRSAQDLSPLCDEKLPREIAPFVVSLNRLFLRVAETFRREREFTDNAAHELRTPLAAMKTQTQVLAKKAGGMPECRDGLENLQASINRAGQLVEQLLSFARLQNENALPETVHFSFLAEEVLREMHPLADRRGQSLETQIGQGIYLQGFADGLAV